MKNRNEKVISPFLKNSYASAFIVGVFLLGLAVISVVVFGGDVWQINAQKLPNIMPVLMAIIGFFAVGYGIMCVVTSKLFQSVGSKRISYNHLQY